MEYSVKSTINKSNYCRCMWNDTVFEHNIFKIVTCLVILTLVVFSFGFVIFSLKLIKKTGFHSGDFLKINRIRKIMKIICRHCV